MNIEQVEVIVNNQRLTGDALKGWLRRNKFKISKKEVEYTFPGPPRERTGDPAKIQWQIRQITGQPPTVRRQPVPQAVPQPVNFQRPPPLGYHEWLTFETIYNAEFFRQSNQELKLGLYSIPVACLDINIVEDPPRVLLDVLGAFLPCLNDKGFDLQAEIASAYTQPADKQVIPLLQSMYKSHEASRNTTVVNQGVHLAVLPYNYNHNDELSPAIGTDLENKAPFEIKRLQAEWRMWNTASRSKIVEVPSPVGDLHEILTPHGEQKWPHRYTPGQRDHPSSVALRGYTGAGEEGNHLVLSSAIPTLFSIKTGVQYIGKSYQGGSKGKDVLEKNCHVSRLRSDYMIAEDLKLTADPCVMVQQELLSMTCKPPLEEIGFQPGDGISIRDLSCLDRTKIYFPPLSIPNAGKGIVAEYNALHGANETFDSFWGEHYAALLGQAKARLLLRYGIQFCTPNPQNFLLEFDQDLQPTDKLVVRDVGDANLHVQITRAIHNHDGSKFNNKYLDKEYDFKANLEHKPYDTETDKAGDDTFYPSGTQFHWHNYSVFKGQYLDDVGQASCTTDIMVRWGHLHDNAYITYLNNSLNLGLPLTQVPEMGRPTTSEDLKQALAGELQRARDMHQVLTSQQGLDAVKRFRSSLRR